jgi:transcriptional regulator of acetoin/glycerol metabolism/DNA-binding CsgD family transcriptional regulator
MSKVGNNAPGALRTALHEYVSGGELKPRVRPEVAASWHRSLTSDLSPDKLEVPYDPESRDGDPLLQAARPVLQRMSEDLESVSMSIVLADPSGRILERSVADATLRGQLDSVMLAPGFRYGEDDVGTNALGMSLLKNEPVIITGDEHFVDALTSMVCAAAPIFDPATETVLGAVDLTGPKGSADSLMLALARQAARSIAERVLDEGAVGDRALLQLFVRERRKVRGPLVAISAEQLVTNAAAAGIVERADHLHLWQQASRAMASSSGPSELEINSSTFSARCEPVYSGGRVVGALIRFSRLHQSTAPVRFSDRATFGWASLRDSEIGIATLVAEGLTNRGIASRLFVSVHTVDFHLRQIYRKLGISSRVELTRKMVESERGIL